MRKTIGILAHVDAGKTTFSEQILYHTHSIRSRGRVDNGNAFLDSDTLERQRGISIFASQAVFEYHNSIYYLVDTPGHVDFSAEMERAVHIMDYAVVLISCAEGVQGHTETVWKLLRKYRVPTLLFLNKTDREGADIQRVLKEIQLKLSPNAFLCDGSQEMIELIAQSEESLLERYLEQGYDKTLWTNAMKTLIKNGDVFPCFCGSALLDIGIEEFLQALDELTETQFEEKLSVKPYKIRYDDSGNRLTFLKITGGSLKTKDLIGGEKVNEIRIYHGERFTCVKEAQAGDLCAVTGLTACLDQEYDATPLLAAKVLFDGTLSAKTMLGYFKILEDENPLLQVSWQEELAEIQVSIMGVIQLEVLKDLVKQRFNTTIDFGKCRILYRETIGAPVTGYGHFEPLRHYAEVHLKLSPGARGSGITFESTCSADVLDAAYQHLVRTHVFEKQHRGILTGSPLTDVTITLLTGRAHEKHTEGGDFRQATYRAIRQGLEQAENILLEPFYVFKIEVDSHFMGRVLSDIQKMYGSFDPPESNGDRVTIHGRGPAETFLDYGRELISLTHGKGSLSLTFDGYEPCHNSDAVIAECAYDRERDTANTSSSIFCKHGVGYPVKWDEVEASVHCK